MMATSDPWKVKQLGQLVHIDQRAWDKMKEGVMITALVAKFTQNPQLSIYL